MKINTLRFGQIEVDEDKVILFKEGIPGLNHLKKYILIHEDEKTPLHWLQSVEDGSIALVLADPFVFKPDYAPCIHEDILTELQAETEEDLIVMTILVIPEDIKKMTANLMAPIVFNPQKRLAKQVILDKGDYPLRFPVYEALKRKGA